MKNVFLTSVALAVLAGAVAAEEAKPIVKASECSAPFPISMFEEKADGSNCEPTTTETVVGELIVFTVAAAGILTAAGVDIPAELAAINP